LRPSVIGRRFLEKLGAHVLIRVFQLDLLGHRHPVVGDGRRTPLLVQGHVAPLGAQRGGHRLGHGIDADLQSAACIFLKNELFSHI
jgi:hypothetical protein